MAEPAFTATVPAIVTVFPTVTVPDMAGNEPMVTELPTVTVPVGNSVTIGSSVSISNFPSTQTVAGTVTVGNATTASAVYVKICGERSGAGPNEAREIQTDNSGVLFARVTPTESTDYNPVKYDPALADAYVNVRQYTGTSVTIGSLPAISGTVTANVPLVSNTPVNQMQALPVVLITDEGTGAYDTGQQLPVEIKTIATSVTIGSLPAISGTVTVGNSVTIGSLPVIFGTVTVGSSVTIGSLPTLTPQLPRVTFIDGSGTVVTANSAVTLFASSSTRSYLLVQVTTGSAFVNVGATATTVNGINLTAGQGYAWETTIPQGAVSLISTTTNSAYVAKEA